MSEGAGPSPGSLSSRKPRSRCTIFQHLRKACRRGHSSYDPKRSAVVVASYGPVRRGPIDLTIPFQKENLDSGGANPNEDRIALTLLNFDYMQKYVSD